MIIISPVPSKYPLPPLVAAEYAAVGSNGIKVWTDGVPLSVTVKALVLLSLNLLD